MKEKALALASVGPGPNPTPPLVSRVTNFCPFSRPSLSFLRLATFLSQHLSIHYADG